MMCSVKRCHTPTQEDNMREMKLAPLIVKARSDRYASTAIPWISAMAYSRVLRVPLYHICNSNCSRYNDNIVHECLIKFCERGAPPDNGNIIEIDDDDAGGGVTSLANDISRLAPLPELLQHFGIVSLLRRAYESRYGPRSGLPCTVHCRLDDVKESPNAHYQKRIEDTRLLKLLEFSQSKYGDVCIETTPHDISMLEGLVKQLNFNVSVRGHPDIDESIWAMANANPLIMSRSNFSLLAGLLNLQTSFSYERWIHFDEIAGTGTLHRGESTRHFQILEWE